MDSILIDGKAMDCFAICANGCSVLKVTNCIGCNFFKTKKQLEKERKACEKRLAKNGFDNRYKDCYEC